MRRTRLIVESEGIRFHFFYDKQLTNSLHVEARHQVSVQQAVDTFFNGDEAKKTVWNGQRHRFETCFDGLCLYWAWLAKGSEVVVISCFPFNQGEASGDEAL